MIPPCNNCGESNCIFCELARTDPRYARLYRERDTPVTPQDCIHRGPQTGLQDCPSCQGNVHVKVFQCHRRGSCSLEKDVGLATCGNCPEKTPFDLQQAYDWKDLGNVIPGDSRKFNSSLIRYQGRLVLATRVHTKSGWSPGRIILSRLDDAFRRQGENVEIAALHPQANLGIEDPRLFVHNGALHVAFTGVEGRGTGMVTNQLYARLNGDLQIEELFAPEFSGRQAWEKNWGFFSQAGQLYAVYHIRGHKILRIDGNKAEPAFQSQTTWPAAIGEPRGGASPVKRGNEWYCFFHDIREAGLPRRVYQVCFYTFEENAPFRINRIGRIPLFSPAESHRPQDDWTPDVVFPCGAFLENNLWHVSAGYFDRWSWLLRFDVNRCEELLDIAPGGRDARLNVSAACLTPHQSYDVWANVYNRNEYELPEQMGGATVIDLGGHIGSFARLCLDRGASRVVSYEPLAENCAAYRQNLRGMEGRYELIEAAAFGDDPPAAATLGGYSLREVGDWERVPVKTVRLGRLECDLLKIDVEGAEYEILAHADLSGVQKICGEGHLGEGLPGSDWLAERLQTAGFRVRIAGTGPQTFQFWAERPVEETTSAAPISSRRVADAARLVPG